MANRHAVGGRRRRRGIDVVVTSVGELLITAGLIVALFLVWQLWWTGIDATAKADVHASAFEQTQVDSPQIEGPKYTDNPPAFTPVGYGETIGMLIVPAWYGVTNNNMPVLEGTGNDVLDQAAAGHYRETQQVGELGNFAVAGHRRTNGNSFLRVDRLEEGDEVIIATKDTWYVYVVTGHEIVEPTDVDVIAPVPGDPSAAPIERMLTMTTCHSLTTGEWGNDHRWITHATFSYWMPRAEGRPASVLNDPGVN
ncbi:MAG: class E sortase [Actinomyces sp.]|uniref:class E sortase n=1 Tax=Actinomyces sp. TaxID=29317 RepID=UPI0026DD8BA1|nr:class E sortase [Actinomyces sp.]MDO4242772.1 class E sortase [Actinomyces sp.]